ncbi:hypothetical protein B5X24_HaOG203255 [Helicoverpa armigera]|uniref:Uncharacterized protein n=1 Tax=Helicoverpa armigera TaxID=29058 RepID=A0A2W1BR13_HELAM|nr:hypothetical protein B5X24_HaOG203255 [Helicoverpa armigera]
MASDDSNLPAAPAQQRSCRHQQHRLSSARAATSSTGSAALVPRPAAPAQQRSCRDQQHRLSSARAATSSTGLAALVCDTAVTYFCVKLCEQALTTYISLGHF